MEKSDIAKQMELYSNAIVAFIVFQGLAYCYNFATNPSLNTLVKTKMSLSVGLTIVFFMTGSLAFIANNQMRPKLEALSGEYGPLVKRLYFGKSVVIILFGLLPILVTVMYGIFHA